MEIANYIRNMIRAGEKIGYFEIFEDRNEEEMNFKYSEDEEYFIEDKYSIEGRGTIKADLYFINFGKDGKSPFTEFAVSINLEDLEYNIIEEKCGEAKVQEVMGFLLNNRADLVESMKRRYGEIRSAVK